MPVVYMFVVCLLYNVFSDKVTVVSFIGSLLFTCFVHCMIVTLVYHFILNVNRDTKQIWTLSGLMFLCLWIALLIK